MQNEEVVFYDCLSTNSNSVCKHSESLKTVNNQI